MTETQLRLASSLAYTPYGFSDAGYTAPTLGLNGQGKDSLSNCYPLGNGHRYYSPVLMRFLAPDTLSPFYKGGINTYAYCSADPVNSMDPSGQTPVSKIPTLIKGYHFTNNTRRDHALKGSKLPRPTKPSAAQRPIQQWYWDDPEVGSTAQSLEWDYPQTYQNRFEQLVPRNRHTYKISEKLTVADLHLDLIESDLKAIKSFSIQFSDTNSVYIHNLEATSKMQVVVGAVEEIRGPSKNLSIYGIFGRFHNS